jgi:hypothetical protein
MSSLDDVFVEDDPDEEILGEILSERVKIPEPTGEIRPQQEFDELDTEGKIVCSLAAVRAMEMKDHRESKEIGPTELGRISPVPEGTIKGKISEIDIIEKTDEGKYYLPGYELRKAKKMIEGDQ